MGFVRTVCESGQSFPSPPPAPPGTVIAPSGIASSEAFGASVVSLGASASPADLPGLALWFDGRAQAYSDAGITPANQPSGRVQRLNQPAPLSGYWNAATTDRRPWREGNALDFRAGEPGQVTQFGTPTIAGDNCSVAFSFTARAAHSAATIVAGAGGPGAWAILVASYRLAVVYAGTWTTSVSVRPGARVVGVLTIGSGQLTIKGFVDGVSFEETTSKSLTATTLSATGIGNGALGVGQFALGQLAMFNGALSSPNRDSLLPFLQSNAPGESPDGMPLLVATGDSICVGTGVSAWPYISQKALIDAATPVAMINGGLHSSSMSTGGVAGISIPDYVTQYVVPRYSAGRAKNIVIAQGITNSINCETANVAATAAAFLAAYYGMCDALKAQGWFVALTTCTPCSAGAQVTGIKGTGFEACRQMVNASILANYLAHGAAVIDFGNQPGMTSTADASGSNFVDGLHPSVAGYVIMANAATPVVGALLAA